MLIPVFARNKNILNRSKLRGHCLVRITSYSFKSSSFPVFLSTGLIAQIQKNCGHSNGKML